MKTVLKNALAAALILVLAAAAGFAAGTHEPWTCPQCGKTGNTGNYCGECGYPAPWLEQVNNQSDPISSPEPVEISSAAFPDEVFRDYIRVFDQDNDGKFSEKELAAVTSINCKNMGISSLTGIGLFPALKVLNCSGNNLTELDVSANTALTQLNCINNHLAEISLERNTKLQFFKATGNQLTDLDLTNNPLMTELSISKNSFTEVDLSCCPRLRTLYISSNMLTALDISGNPGLEIVFCDNNLLTRLDTDMNTELQGLECANNQIAELRLENNRKLERLRCETNRITRLDISRCGCLIRALEDGIRYDKNKSWLVLYRNPDRNDKQGQDEVDTLRDTNYYGMRWDKDTEIVVTADAGA